MTHLSMRIYSDHQADDPATPAHISERLRYHQQQGHTDIRVLDFGDKGYTIETYEDRDGRIAGHRHDLQQTHPTPAP
jgi:hypothetical protein